MEKLYCRNCNKHKWEIIKESETLNVKRTCLKGILKNLTKDSPCCASFEYKDKYLNKKQTESIINSHIED